MNLLKNKRLGLGVIISIILIAILIVVFIIVKYIDIQKAKEKAEIDAKNKAEIEAIEKETKETLEEYVNNSWCYFDDCDAERMYIQTSQAFDYYTEEENFGYWIQILGDDYFGGKTQYWETFQNKISRRGEFYSKTIIIPNILSENPDIKKLNQLIVESNNLCTQLYGLVTNPKRTMTKTEFKNNYNQQTEELSKVVDEAFDIIDSIRENHID